MMKVYLKADYFNDHIPTQILCLTCSRDRNREHAKNTRLRKKAYVVKLKELVDQMNGQKDMEEKERRALGERVHDTVRYFSVLHDFTTLPTAVLISSNIL